MTARLRQWLVRLECALPFVGVALVAYAVGHWCGRTRHRPPATTTERTRETTAQQSTATRAEAIQWQGALDTAASGSTTTKPDGTVVVRWRTKTKEVKSAAKVVREVVVETKYVDKWHEKRVEVKAPQPRWSVGAVGGLQWTGERVYGATIGVRALGPVWVEGTVTNKAALIGVRVTW